MAFVVRRKSQRHRSGSKDYHIVRVHDSLTGQGFIIRRWAKAGQWGSGVRVLRAETSAHLDDLWNETQKLKFDLEYNRPLYDDTKVLDRKGEAVQVLMEYVQRSSAVGDAFDWLFGEETELAGVAAEPEPTVSIEDRVRENNTWGSW